MYVSAPYFNCACRHITSTSTLTSARQKTNAKVACTTCICACNSHFHNKEHCSEYEHQGLPFGHSLFTPFKILALASTILFVPV